MIARRAVKVKFIALVERLETKPILGVPSRILHGDEVCPRSVLEVTKVLALLRVNHGVIISHNEYELFQGLEIVGIGGILLAGNLVVDVWQKVPILAVGVQIRWIS